MRTLKFFAIGGSLATCLAIASPAQAALISFENLDSATLNYTQDAPGVYSGVVGGTGGNSFNGADYNGDGDVSNSSATWRVGVDFNTHDGIGREVIFESGGGGDGNSLSYINGNVLSWHVKDGGTVREVTHTLTAAQIAAGTLEIVTTVAIDEYGDSDYIALFVDGFLVADSLANGTTTLNDFDGSDAGNLGSSNAGVSFGNGTGAPFNSGSLGTIGGTTNQLQVFFGTAIAIPEPSSAMLLLGVLGSLLVGGRRRRQLGTAG